MKIKVLILFALMLTVGVKSFAQEKFALDSKSEMKVDGSSTVSEWSVSVADIKGQLNATKAIKLKKGAALFSSLSFSFEVEKMESGRGPIMNSKIKSALKNDQHPTVSFTSKENKITAVNGSSCVVEISGTLEVAGVKQVVIVTANCKYNAAAKTISMEGNKDITLSMFKIEKPTAFFGKLQTMDELNVKFNLNFTKN